MTHSRWRRMLVVVEIPIRGRLTETGLCNFIRDALLCNLDQHMSLDTKTGAPRVKSYKRVVNAEVRKRMKEIRRIKAYWSKR